MTQSTLCKNIKLHVTEIKKKIKMFFLTLCLLFIMLISMISFTFEHGTVADASFRLQIVSGDEFDCYIEESILLTC